MKKKVGTEIKKKKKNPKKTGICEIISCNKNKIRSHLESGKTVKQTFSDNFQSLEHQPHDSKFVENMKYNLDKAKNPGNKQNAADDIINVINMISTSHPFLKEIVQTNGKPPNLICYTENQLKHFSSALKTSVIGVDRTFNLRPCFITTTVSEIETNYQNSVGPYLSDKVIPTIKEYIYGVRKSDKVPLHWKNNNCESLNHILKLNQNWTPDRLPELIQSLHKEIQLQEALIKGALYGHSDFELNSSLLKLQCTKAQRQSKTEKEKENIFQKFLAFGTKQPPSKFITSTDGKIVIPKTATVARKPGQKRRIRSTKTVTNKRQKTE